MKASYSEKCQFPIANSLEVFYPFYRRLNSGNSIKHGVKKYILNLNAIRLGNDKQFWQESSGAC